MEKIHASAKSGTTMAWCSFRPSSLPGRNGFHIEIAQAETRPANTRKTSVWLR